MMVSREDGLHTVMGSETFAENHITSEGLDPPLDDLYRDTLTRYAAEQYVERISGCCIIDQAHTAILLPTYRRTTHEHELVHAQLFAERHNTTPWEPDRFFDRFDIDPDEFSIVYSDLLAEKYGIPREHTEAIILPDYKAVLSEILTSGITDAYSNRVTHEPFLDSTAGYETDELLTNYFTPYATLNYSFPDLSISLNDPCGYGFDLDTVQAADMLLKRMDKNADFSPARLISDYADITSLSDLEARENELPALSYTDTYKLNGSLLPETLVEKAVQQIAKNTLDYYS